MKTGTITKCEFKKKFEKDGNTTYYHDVTMDNGDIGNIGSRSEMPSQLQPGQTLTYQLIPNGNYTPKMKLETGFKKKGFEREPFCERAIGFAASYAKDALVASWTSTTVKPLTTTDMLMAADVIYAWMMKKHKEACNG